MRPIEDTLDAILSELRLLNSNVGGRAVLVGAEPIAKAVDQVGISEAAIKAAQAVTQIAPATSQTPTREQVGAAANQAISQVFTREQVGAALIALATEKGREAAGAVLATFQATKLAEVAVASYVALMDRIAKARA